VAATRFYSCHSTIHKKENGMKHRTAWILATALTAFVLVLVGGIVFSVTPQVAAVNPTPTDTATALPTDTATQVPTFTATATPPSATNTPQNLYLTPAQASQIALTTVSGAKLLAALSLVNYKGQMAYEAILGRTTLYIDAFSGAVLFKYVAPPPTPTLEPSPVPSATDMPTAADSGNTGGSNNGQNKQHQSHPPAPVPQKPAPKPSGGGTGKGGGGGGDDDGGGKHGGGHDH
jgi:uncharacterized membrane protein YgcG